MEFRFSSFRLSEAKNFLAAPYSEEHGEGVILSDDIAQMGAGLLIENIGDANGMIVIVKEDEMAFVIKTFGNDKVGFIDFKKRNLTEAGKIFNEMNLDCFGILIDAGQSEDQRRKYRIMSHDQVLM